MSLARRAVASFSALQRAEIAEICVAVAERARPRRVSVLFNEPKLLKLAEPGTVYRPVIIVSVLFNEPKLLKSVALARRAVATLRFSALQRAEIAEIHPIREGHRQNPGFSALQRAEIAEIHQRHTEHA